MRIRHTAEYILLGRAPEQWQPGREWRRVGNNVLARFGLWFGVRSQATKEVRERFAGLSVKVELHGPHWSDQDQLSAWA